MSRTRLLLLLVALAVVQLVLAANVAPVDDELYYWCWSKDLQPSYFDHPPLTAYLIRLATAVFGDTLLGVRFFACLSTFGILLLIGELTARRGIAWLLLTPMVALGSILMTPDSPLLFFWTAYAVWLVKMQERPGLLRYDWGWWALGGCLLGLGGLSKYTMALAVPGALLTFLTRPSGGRAWRLGFAVHLLVAAALFSPVVIFNSSHEFAPMRYQMAHASGHSSHGFSIGSLSAYVGVQIVLIGALPFVLLPWCLRRRRELVEDNRLRASLWLFLPPSLLFLAKAAVGRVEGNWPLVCDMTLLPLALRWLDDLPDGARKRWAFPSAFAVPGAATAFLVAHLLLHLPLPASIDRLSKSEARFESVQRVAEWARTEGIGKIYGVDYQMTSQMRFQRLDADQLPGVGRPSHFTMRAEKWDEQQDVHVLWYMLNGMTPPVLPTEEYLRPRVVAKVPEFINGRRGGDYVLVRYERAARPVGGAVMAVASRQSEADRLR
jgi:4-amino-4-deoxy-L-arabinose transferase-like glycosyltransferase